MTRLLLLLLLAPNLAAAAPAPSAPAPSAPALSAPAPSAPASSAPASSLDGWDGYQWLMWQDRTPTQLQGLAALGFTGAKLRATGGQVDLTGRQRLRTAGLRYYLENLATDFYSPYHRYTPGQPVTAQFDAVRARRLRDPLDPLVTLRNPGLSDPEALARITQRLIRIVQQEASGHPLFYNLADEAGIADLAAAWDFDTAPASLAGFRTWLQSQYPDLQALNGEWGTDYQAWDAVQPQLTDTALRRTDQNFAAWSDFRAWMDLAFTQAVQAGADALHGADPAALAALEGAQVPGWGGWDYARLAPTVDAMEIYDFGEALDLATAFNPALRPLRTSFATGPREAHATWRNLLHGGRGTIVWDENDDVARPDGSPGPRGQELAALIRAIAPTAALLHEATPDPDGVAILYSQASFRIQWLLDRQAGDHDWAARDAEREYDDNAWRASRRTLVERLAALAIQPRYLSTAQLEAGVLRQPLGSGNAVDTLLLPHAIALSDGEIAAIDAFQAAGGTVLADTEPGLFDGHGRRRPASPLPQVLPHVLPHVLHPQPMRPDGEPPLPAMLDALAALLRTPPRVALLGPDGQRATGIAARWFRHPRGVILALQAAQPWSAPAQVRLRFPVTPVLLDLRAGRPIPQDAPIPLDPIEPTILLLVR